MICTREPYSIFHAPFLMAVRQFLTFERWTISQAENSVKPLVYMTTTIDWILTKFLSFKPLNM